MVKGEEEQFLATIWMQTGKLELILPHDNALHLVRGVGKDKVEIYTHDDAVTSVNMRYVNCVTIETCRGDQL